MLDKSTYLKRISLIQFTELEHVTKILIKMRPLSTDGAILILVFLATMLRFCLTFIAGARSCKLFQWSMSSSDARFSFFAGIAYPTIHI